MRHVDSRLRPCLRLRPRAGDQAGCMAARTWTISSGGIDSNLCSCRACSATSTRMSSALPVNEAVQPATTSPHLKLFIFYAHFPLICELSLAIDCRLASHGRAAKQPSCQVLTEPDDYVAPPTTVGKPELSVPFSGRRSSLSDVPAGSSIPCSSCRSDEVHPQEGASPPRWLHGSNSTHEPHVQR